MKLKIELMMASMKNELQHYHISRDLSHDSVVPHVLICRFARSVEFFRVCSNRGTGLRVILIDIGEK